MDIILYIMLGWVCVGLLAIYFKFRNRVDPDNDVKARLVVYKKIIDGFVDQSSPKEVEQIYQRTQDELNNEAFKFRLQMENYAKEILR